MGSAFSKPQPVYPLPNPAPNPSSSAYGYQPFGFFHPGQGGRKKDRMNGYGMYPPVGYAYPQPVYPAYPQFGYPGFAAPPGPSAMPAPFIPPPPAIRPPVDPGPPVFMPAASQHYNTATVQSPPVIPATTRRRRSATPYPTSMPELQQTPEPQPPPQPQRPSAAADDLNRVLEPIEPAAFGPSSSSRPLSQPRPRNPLPPPPRDVYDMTPYRGLLNLPQTTALLTSTYGTVNRPPPREQESVDRKKSLKGLFRSLSGSKGKKRDENHVPFVPVVITQPQTSTSPPGPSHHSDAGTGSSSTSPSSTRIRFDHHTYPGFMNHSPHRIIYHNKTYPTVLHLHEAMKFIDHRPDLSERIRNTAQVQEVYPLSASLQESVRPDWGQIFLKMMEEALYLKFKQHPDPRSLLMGTGNAELVYAETKDSFWGDGRSGEGKNELGKALVRVRDKLRAEGYNS